MNEISNWVIEETKMADFGDKRLNKRYGNILERFCSSPNKSIPASCKGWSETLASYRFLNHPSVTADKMLSTHIDAMYNDMLLRSWLGFSGHILLDLM